MSNEELCIEIKDGKNYISPALLERILEDRDRSIHRIEKVTDYFRKRRAAATQEEYDSIKIPEEFVQFGDTAEWMMSSYVSGFSLVDQDEKAKVFYGAMGSIASLFIPTLYRGELCDYGVTSACSSLGRAICSANYLNDEERCLHFFIGQMRICCFSSFLSLFRQYSEYPLGDTMPHIIAQHYGMDTQYLDVTDDVKVALFFACCKHLGNNRYRPITDEDIEQLGTQGVLYVGIDCKADIIGYQPFYRCHKQRGYYIDTTFFSNWGEKAVLPVRGYAKCYFDRTPELSKRLFDEYDGGKVLFPDDGLSQFGEEINQIQTTKTFPLSAFEYVYSSIQAYFSSKRDIGMLSDEIYNLFSDKERLLVRLYEKGYIFTEKLGIRTEKEKLIEKLNQAWNPNIFVENEGIVYSPFIVIPAEDNHNL